MGLEKVNMEFDTYTDDLVTTDIKINKWDGVHLENPLYLECNGPWLYPRNSKEPIGYHHIKTRKRELTNMSYFKIPYHDWIEKEDQMTKQTYLVNSIYSNVDMTPKSALEPEVEQPNSN